MSVYSAAGQACLAIDGWTFSTRQCKHRGASTPAKNSALQ